MSSFFGSPKADTLYGGDDADRLFGYAGNDRLFGGNGNDNLYGGGGADRLYGGAGSDHYHVTPGDRVHEKVGQGWDFVLSTQSYALQAGQSIDVMLPVDYYTGYNAPIKFYGNELPQVIWGNSGANVLEGRGGNDRLLGNQGDDILRGGSGDDWLYGHFGNDTLEGGLGKDKFYGGSERDTFVYRSVADSTAKSSGRDAIQDFSQSDRDVIDLHRIDADSGRAGNQAFRFVGDAAFSGKAGELRTEVTKSGAMTLVSGDVTGDGKADFSVVLYGAIDLHKGDFIL